MSKTSPFFVGLTGVALSLLPIGTALAQEGALVRVAPLQSSPAYESSRVLRTGRGTLIFLCGYNSGPTQFIQLHDAATVPTNGAVPKLILSVPAGNFSFAVPLSGMPFVLGIVVCNSSTGPTKTSGANDCFFTAVVR